MYKVNTTCIDNKDSIIKLNNKSDNIIFCENTCS